MISYEICHTHTKQTARKEIRLYMCTATDTDTATATVTVTDTDTLTVRRYRYCARGHKGGGG